MRLGIVDIGTLSLRFDVYELSPLDNVTLLLRERRMPRLGEGLYEDGCITRESLERLLKTLKELKSQGEEQGVSRYLLTGTSAFREARNAELVCAEILAETGFTVRIISGAEEARLTTLGILGFEAREGVSVERAALVDVGGGSTEVIQCQAKKLEALCSLPIGVLRMQQNFNLYSGGERPTAETLQAMKEVIKKELDLHSVSPSQSYPLLFGSSGTARNLERIANKKRIPFAELEALVEHLSSLNRAQLSEYPGVDPARVIYLLAGSLIISEVMRRLQAEELYVTHYSLRHGVLLEELERFKAL